MVSLRQMHGRSVFPLKIRKDYKMVVEEGLWNRSCWKWISIIWRLVPACINAYVYCSFIWHLANLVDRMLNGSRLVIISSCYLSIIHLQIFRGEELIRLTNRYLRFFYRVTSLSIRLKTGFGGVRELGLILLSLCCQVLEIVFVLGLFKWGTSLHSVLSWTSSTYILIYTNIVIRISCFWYLSIGVLYSKLNDFLRLRRRRKQELKKAMTLFREMSYLVTSLQEISNKYLCLNLLQIFISMIALSYKMILEQQFYQITICFFFAKTMLDMLVLSLAIEGAVIQFSYTRDQTLGMFFLSELTEWNRTVRGWKLNNKIRYL